MKKIILLILDGFGIRDSESGNVTKMAQIPVINKILEKYSISHLEASGEEVGLPKGQSGNCEAGHMTIGCGRIIKQPLTIINKKIKDKSFFENDTLLDMMDFVNENNSTLHLIGMISDSNIHSSIEHFYATLALAKIKKVKSVIFHFITDGQDSNPNSATIHIAKFMEKASKLGLGTIGTICGKYFAMDKEGNYDRIKKAYDAICYNIGNSFPDYSRCLDMHYKNDITDEFINPSIILKGSNIKDNDGVIFVDYRSEMIVELISALTDENFNMFNVKKFSNIKVCTLYNVSQKIESAYTNESISNTFGKYLSDLEFKQTRIAENEKYPYVTYFFDGADELNDKNLYKILIPGVNVPRYDMKPEMSASDVTQAVINAIDEDFDFILANFANPDSVAHSGNLPACVRAVETLDVCISQILEYAQDNFYELVITSDHGNVEYMKDEEGNIMNGHTLSKVPFVICNEKYKLKSEGTLKDVIPTIIDLFEISKPKEMTGVSLIEIKK